MDLNKILSNKVSFEGVINKLSDRNYCIDSEIFASLGYILKDNQIIVYAQKNGVLSIGIGVVREFCDELLMIAEEYIENNNKNIRMHVEPCSTGKGRAKYEQQTKGSKRRKGACEKAPRIRI